VGSLTVPADYTPTVITVLGTLAAALFTTVISQYFFAPWLEVRKQILTQHATGKLSVADEAREFVHALGKLQLVRSSFDGTQRFQQHWDTAMTEYRERLDHFGRDFPHIAVPLKKSVRNLIVATKWSLEIVYFRKSPDKAPVDEVATIALQLSKAIDPTTFPPKRMYHTWLGLRRYRRLMKSIQDITFGD
jgi:hypothetical protein